MSDLPKIDVIIPAYKAQNTILRTLSSIAEQEILEDLEVTIVNDADGIGYKEFVDMFSPYMKIKEITMDANKDHWLEREYDSYEDCYQVYGDETEYWNDEEIERKAREIEWEKVIAVNVGLY